MTVNKRDSLAPNAIVPPQGDLGAEGTRSPEPSTHSALGDTSAHGDLAGYRAKQAQYGTIGADGGGAGIGVGYPCSLSTSGSIPADSNMQPETTTGGTDSFVRTDGGSDCNLDDYDSGQSGGRSLL